MSLEEFTRIVLQQFPTEDWYFSSKPSEHAGSFCYIAQSSDTEITFDRHYEYRLGVTVFGVGRAEMKFRCTSFLDMKSEMLFFSKMCLKLSV